MHSIKSALQGRGRWVWRMSDTESCTNKREHVWPLTSDHLYFLSCLISSALTPHFITLVSFFSPFLLTQVWNHCTVILGSANASSSAYDDYADYFIVDDKVLFLEQEELYRSRFYKPNQPHGIVAPLAAIKCSTFICIWKKCRAGGLLLMVEVCFVCVWLTLQALLIIFEKIGVKNDILFTCTKQDLALVKCTVHSFLSSLFNIMQLHPILPVLLHVGIRDGSSTQLMSPPSLPYWKHGCTVEMTGSCLLSPPKEKEVHFQKWRCAPHCLLH